LRPQRFTLAFAGVRKETRMQQHSSDGIFDAAPLQAEAAEKLEHGSSDIFDLQDKPIGRVASAYHTFASVLAISLMTGFITLEVFFRYVLGSGFRWIQEVCGLCLFFLVISCQAHCWQKDRHIKLNMLYDRMPRLMQRCCNVLSVVCGAIFFGALAYQSVMDLPYQFATSEATPELMIPNWYISVGVLIGCLLLLAMYLRWFAAGFNASRGRK
jgi:C4-dicarboxylate transporter DctQ subunit